MIGGTLRLATRGSRLALAQAALAADALRAVGVPAVETVVVRTQGDREAATPVTRLEGEGWFSAALEMELVAGRADAAVHSAKDLPSRLGDGLAVAAFLERADCRDGLVTQDGSGLEALRPGATVGTSSARRAAFLRVLRPDLVAVPIRGNVDTRLRKLEAGEVAGLLIACAGLDRIGASERLSQRFDPRLFVPAPCQGAIASRRDRQPRRGRLRPGGPPRDPRRGGRRAGGARRPGRRLPAAARRLGPGQEEGRLVLTAALDAGGEERRASWPATPTPRSDLGERVAARLR